MSKTEQINIESHQEAIDANEQRLIIAEEMEFEEMLKNRKIPEKPEKIENIKDKIEKAKESSHDNKKKTPSKKELEKMIKEQSKAITKQAEEIKKRENYKPDLDYILKNEKFFKKFLEFDLNFDNNMNISQIMHKWTNFKYNPYGELRTNYIKQIGERVVIIEELSKIFNNNFMTYISNKNYRFDALNFEICKYIGKINEKDKETTAFEYFFIRSMLSKLLICMLSNVDKCFSADRVQINMNFKRAVQNYLNEFGHILKTNNKTTRSWEVFEYNLFLAENDSHIFIFNSAEDLKDKIKECINDDKEEPHFELEQLIANTIKTFIPTVAYSYFMVIKNIYLMGRLLSIYANKKLFQGKSKEELINDLYIIASSLTIDYEVSYLANLNTRCTPVCRNGREMSKQTEMYYVNHLIAGPQYFILKQIELSLPTIYTTFKL